MAHQSNAPKKTESHFYFILYYILTKQYNDMRTEGHSAVQFFHLLILTYPVTCQTLLCTSQIPQVGLALKLIVLFPCAVGCENVSDRTYTTHNDQIHETRSSININTNGMAMCLCQVWVKWIVVVSMAYFVKDYYYVYYVSRWLLYIYSNRGSLAQIKIYFTIIKIGLSL